MEKLKLKQMEVQLVLIDSLALKIGEFKSEIYLIKYLYK